MGRQAEEDDRSVPGITAIVCIFLLLLMHYILVCRHCHCLVTALMCSSVSVASPRWIRSFSEVTLDDVTHGKAVALHAVTESQPEWTPQWGTAD